MATNSSFGAYESKPKEVEIIDIQIGVFFDGTRNNRTNSRIAGKTEENDDYIYTVSEDEIKDYEAQIGGDNLSKKNKTNTSNKTEPISELVRRNKELKKLKDDESWNNDLSNIARLEKHYSKVGNAFSFYIEGIGTMDAKEDSMQGFAMGSGDYGIVKKAEKASTLIYKRIKKKYSFLQKETKIRLYLDIYGFSRGAATARHFVAKINEYVYKRISSIKFLTIVKKEVRFLGLYDTVSSYDPTLELDKFLKEKSSLDLKVDLENIIYGNYLTTIKENVNLITVSSRLVQLLKAFVLHMKNKGFENDVEELGLRSLNEAKEIVHFTSLNEHRQFFSLTTAIRDKSYIEIGFPGVHSDIGGSYIHNSSENKVIMSSFSKMIGDYILNIKSPNESEEMLFKSDIQRLIRGGWFDEHELNIEGQGALTIVFKWIDYIKDLALFKIPKDLVYWRIKAERKRISNKYSYIFLYLMGEITNKKNEKNVIDLIKLKKEFVLPDGKNDNYFKVNLQEVAQLYRDHINGVSNLGSLNVDDQLNDLMWIHRTDMSSSTYNKKSSENKRINLSVIDLEALAKSLKKTEAETKKMVERQLLFLELRHRYFHFSADASIGYLPRYDYKDSDKYSNFKYDVSRYRKILSQ